MHSTYKMGIVFRNVRLDIVVDICNLPSGAVNLATRLMQTLRVALLLKVKSEVLRSY